MNMKMIVATVLAVVLAPAACAPRAPGGDTSGDSAGDNQPNAGAACDVTSDYSSADPIATFAAPGDVRYDVFAELQDADCDTVTMGGLPLTVFVVGTIDNKSADYLDSAQRSKAVDSPYHLTAFVTRGVQHDMGFHVSTDVKSWDRIRASDAEFIHCHINRDMRPMQGLSTDALSNTQKISDTGRGAAFCHFRVPVG